MKLPARYSAARMQERNGAIPQIIFLLFLALVMLGFLLYVREPQPYQAAPVIETEPGKIAPTASPTLLPPTPTATMIEQTPTATPLPQEFLENREQTIGIIAATIVLVIIILGGTLRGIWTRQRE